MGLLSRATRARAAAVAVLVGVLPAGSGAAEPHPLYAVLLPSSFGLRLAFAGPIGSAASHVPMSEELAWQVPIQLDVLWTFPRPSRAFGAGGYASWGPAGAGDAACADGASCSAQAARAGAQALWTFHRWRPGSGLWVGAGAGWEWASRRRERLGSAATTRWDGPEVSIQGGAAWHVGRGFAIGPFALVGLGRYRRVALETDAESASASIGDRASHAWIHGGVRGTFDVGP